MNIKERAAQHFAERLSNEMRSLVVPEWGEEGDEARIYYKPMNASQQQKIFQSMSDGTVVRGCAMALACRALDDKGKLIWGGGEVQVTSIMKEYDPLVVQRIAKEMGSMEDLTPPDEDSEDSAGNDSATP